MYLNDDDDDCYYYYFTSESLSLAEKEEGSAFIFIKKIVIWILRTYERNATDKLIVSNDVIVVCLIFAQKWEWDFIIDNITSMYVRTSTVWVPTYLYFLRYLQ